MLHEPEILLKDSIGYEMLMISNTKIFVIMLAHIAPHSYTRHTE